MFVYLNCIFIYLLIYIIIFLIILIFDSLKLIYILIIFCITFAHAVTTPLFYQHSNERDARSPGRDINWFVSTQVDGS